MALRVHNYSVSERRMAFAYRSPRLKENTTGLPVFVLPTRKVDAPELRYIGAPEMLKLALGPSRDSLDTIGERSVDLFFRAGGTECFVYQLPYRGSLYDSLAGTDGGFRRRTGLYTLLDHGDIADLILCPTSAFTPEIHDCSNLLLRFAENSARYFAILDAPSNVSTDRLVEYAQDLRSERSALYAGSLSAGRNGLRLPASPLAAATYQQSDRRRRIDFTPANLPLSIDLPLAEEFSDEEIDRLQGASINVVRSINRQHLVIWGARTLAHTDQFNQFIGCVRFLRALTEELEGLMEPFVWSPATESERAKAESLVAHFFTELYSHERRPEAIDLGESPKFSLSLDTEDEAGAKFILDLSIYLTLPMTWVQVNLRPTGGIS